MSRTKAIRLAPAEAHRLADLAAAADISVSALVSDALEDAIGRGLNLRASPLAAGKKVIGPRLDDDLIADAESEAGEYELSFSAYARAALGGYLMLLEELGSRDELGDAPSVEYGQLEIAADGPNSDGQSVAPFLAWAAEALTARRPATVTAEIGRDGAEDAPSASLAPEVETLRSPQTRPRSAPTVVSGCLHVTRAKPDAAGYVECEECGRYAPILPPESPEVAHLLERERARRLAETGLRTAGGPVLLSCGHLAEPPIPNRCLRCGRWARRSSV